MSVLGFENSTVIAAVVLLILLLVGLLSSFAFPSIIGSSDGSSSSVSLEPNSQVVEDINIDNSGLQVKWSDIVLEYQNAQDSSVETTITVETSEVTESPSDIDIGLGSPPEQISTAQTDIVTSDGSTSISREHGSQTSLSDTYEFGSSIVDITRDGRVSLLLKFTVIISNTDGIEEINNREVSRFVSFDAESLDISNVNISGSLGANAVAPP